MDVREQVLLGLLVLLAPIAVDVLIGAVRRKPAYRVNDLLTNLTLGLLTAMVGVVLAGATLALYVHVHARHAALDLPAEAATTWLLGFIGYDFLYYWAHRAHHRVAVLWTLHTVHHSGEDMNLGLAVRQSALGEATLWPFFLPLAALGVPPQAYLGLAAIQAIFQYAIHNTYVPALGPVEHVLVTPSQHRVHHGRNRVYLDKNFGNVLVLWDRLFGTYQPELREHPPVYGLRTGVRTWDPWTIHVHELRRLLGKLLACRGADRLRCVLRAPDWTPPSLRREQFQEPPDDGPSRRFRRHDPPITGVLRAYCCAQFVALLASVLLWVWSLPSLAPAAAGVYVGLIFAGAWTLGGLLGGRPRFLKYEWGRLSAVALLGAPIAAHAGAPPAALVPFFGLPAASGIFLARLRRTLQSSDPTIRGSHADHKS